MRLAIVAATFFAGACCTSLPQMPPKRVSFPEPVPQYARVVSSSEVWRDDDRERDVPVRIYAPDGAAARLPVVLFSHGIGEDRDSYAYFGEALARHGFLAVHMTHAGTDRAVLERGYLHLYRAVQQPINWINRPLDVSFVLDQLATRRDADLERVSIVGHSAGAFTAFASAGMRMPDGEVFRDPRVKVIVPMSMPRLGGTLPADAFESIETPALNITGTCDTSIVYRTFPRHRRIPFESTRSPRQYLVTLEGVNHDTFVDDDPRRDLIATIAIAFLRAWLLGDENARAWFDDPGLAQADGTRISVERKHGRAR